MTAMPTKEELDEIGRVGMETYRRLVRPRLRKEDEFKELLFDVDTGDYEIDKDSKVAYARLRARRPDGRFLALIAGYTIGGSFGGSIEKYRDPLG